MNSVFRNKPLMTLALGHFSVDMFGGLLPVLYPLLTDKYDLDLKTVGFVALAYSGASSLSQPAFGLLADRIGTRFTGLALVWSAVFFTTIGFAPSFEMLILLAAIAGLGSGAFHPFGAISANAVMDKANRNEAMSIYSGGGILGSSLGPLIGVGLFAVFGTRGTAAMLIPGILVAVFLVSSMRAHNVPGRNALVDAVAPAVPWAVIGVIVATQMLRLFPTLGIQNFIPLWYRDMGYGPAFYGALASTLMFAMAFGNMGTGRLADRYGRRTVILATTLLSIPAVLGLAQWPGIPGFFFAAAIGLLAAATVPLLLVMAQQLMSGRAGLASGAILGLGFVAGAIGAPVFGAIADSIGTQNAVRTQAFALLMAAAAAWFLPTEANIRALADTDEP
jgi:FSR family fosmidomycin resistance protein-like MFS transporter